jgi:hypothetical protein
LATFLPSSPSLVESVVYSGWRRRLFVIALEQFAVALAVVFAGAIVMLLLGTQILAWYWLLLLAATGLILGVWRIRHQMPARYKVAQLLDERLALNDSLSTAWFLRSSPDLLDGPIARAQLAYAEEIAARVRPVKAFPLGGRQSWAITGALAAVVFGLFGVRYFVHSSMSLRPGLISLHFGGGAEDDPAAAKAEEKKTPTMTRRAGETRELASGTHQDSQSAWNQQPSTPTDPKSEQNPSTPQSGQSSNPQAGNRNDSKEQQSAANSEKQDGQPGTEQNKDQQSASREPSEQQQGNSRDQNASAQPSSQGLLDKMKEALSGMMAKMRQNSSSQDARQQARNSSGSKSTQSQGSSQKDEKAQSQSAQNGDSSQDAQATAQASAMEKAQAAAGASSDEKAQEKGSDPQSGAGRQDGAKSIKDAEQLKAMGKLAEIIGKRSASLTGEMSIEKPSGPQQLQTQYSDRLGQHADLGGEINRDQVPLEYQQYVREYMNQIHKQANAQ